MTYVVLFTDGKELEVDADRKSDVTTNAIQAGLMTKDDCFDIQIITEKGRPEIKVNAIVPGKFSKLRELAR